MPQSEIKKNTPASKPKTTKMQFQTRLYSLLGVRAHGGRMGAYQGLAGGLEDAVDALLPGQHDFGHFLAQLDARHARNLHQLVHAPGDGLRKGRREGFETGSGMKRPVQALGRCGGGVPVV